MVRKRMDSVEKHTRVMSFLLGFAVRLNKTGVGRFLRHLKLLTQIESGALEQDGVTLIGIKVHNIPRLPLSPAGTVLPQSVHYAWSIDSGSQHLFPLDEPTEPLRILELVAFQRMSLRYFEWWLREAGFRPASHVALQRLIRHHPSCIHHRPIHALNVVRSVTSADARPRTCGYRFTAERQKNGIPRISMVQAWGPGMDAKNSDAQIYLEPGDRYLIMADSSLAHEPTLAPSSRPPAAR